MSKMSKIAFMVLVLVVTACIAEPVRPRNARLQLKLRPRVRFLARQQAVPTPYPSADELKPVIPFDEGDSAAAEPDLTYGPPPDDVSDNTLETLPSSDKPQDFAPNPDAEEFNVAEANVAARLTKAAAAAKLRRRDRQQTAARAQHIVAAAPASIIVDASRYIAEPAQIVAAQPFAYTAQLQFW